MDEIKDETRAEIRSAAVKFVERIFGASVDGTLLDPLGEPRKNCELSSERQLETSTLTKIRVMAVEELLEVFASTTIERLMRAAEARLTQPFEGREFIGRVVKVDASAELGFPVAEEDGDPEPRALQLGADALLHYREQLIKAGATEEQADKTIADMKHEADLLDRGVCPKCGASIEAKLDPRQAGVSALPGQWFNYRCGCGFACDRKVDVPSVEAPHRNN